MLTLFVDTTFGITVGVLDENNSWKSYQFVNSNKSSSIVHKMIKDRLEEVGKDETAISKLIQVSGPGSYTGMRVSDGISQVFEWQNIETYAFYHFQVPRLLGFEQGLWVSKAFKGEIFCHYWNESESKNYLIKEQELEGILEEDREIFTSHGQDFVSKSTQTSILIKEKSLELFKTILHNKLKEPLYYYRSLEDEFTKSK